MIANDTESKENVFAIETRGLCKSFGSRKAVSGLDLSVRKGEFFALLGVNGAEKPLPFVC